MAIKIGHSSIDERGKASGGSAGDQTKKEVCIRTWYNKGWNVVLRPKNSVVAEKSAKACEQACANDKLGYDQGGRNTLYKEAVQVNFDISKITKPCESDCSSLMHVCVIAGGVKINYGSNGFTTRTMRKRLLATGEYEELTDSKYLTSDEYLKRGDILVKEGSHTVMALEDGAKVVEASKPSKPVTPETPTRPELKFKVGDTVQFNGTVHYSNPNAESGKACKKGTAKVTVVNKSAKHRYHLVRISGGGSNVYGFVDEEFVTAVEVSKPVTPPQKPTVPYYPKYTGVSSSINTVLKAIGAGEYAGKWNDRIPVAKANGIVNYKGTMTQNLNLVGLARKGKLVKP